MTRFTNVTKTLRRLYPDAVAEYNRYPKSGGGGLDELIVTIAAPDGMHWSEAQVHERIISDSIEDSKQARSRFFDSVIREIEDGLGEPVTCTPDNCDKMR